MFVFLFLVASATMALPVIAAASDCTVCELENSFTVSNGYSCFQLNNGSIACTCPDKRYTIDKPCRICDREDICGDANPENFCAETSSASLGVQNNDTQYYACFCSDMSFYVGEACPSTSSNSTF